MQHSDLSAGAKAVLEALCQSAEGTSDGNWRDVYLDNAKALLPKLSANSYRSYLRTLSDAGFYKPIDGYAWGSVRDDAFQVVPKEDA